MKLMNSHLFRRLSNVEDNLIKEFFIQIHLLVIN